MSMIREHLNATRNANNLVCRHAVKQLKYLGYGTLLALLQNLKLPEPTLLHQSSPAQGNAEASIALVDLSFFGRIDLFWNFLGL